MSKKVKVKFNDNNIREFDEGIKISEVLNCDKSLKSPIAAIFNGRIVELDKRVYKDAAIKPVTTRQSLGVKIYLRGLIFILIKAVKELMPEADVIIEHSLNNAIYGEIHGSSDINEKDIEKIKSKMQEIVKNDECIEKIRIRKEQAEEIFRRNKMDDKLRLFKYINYEYVNLYKCGDLYDYFYGAMVPSTGYIKLFDIKYYKPGFILMYPHEKNPLIIPPFKDLPKLARVFKETEDWVDIIDVADVGGLNDKVVSNEINELILVSEGLHEKKIASIADKIYENRDKIKIVLVSGPSSSGKTTFAKRLAIQLKVLGLKPYAISLDNYFINRDMTPKDKNGNYDFESIEALDIELFNKHLATLLDGGEVELPIFNFITGKREEIGYKYKMQSESILIIEGIHGLNERLTSSILKENKYKIYISALTQLNIDDHSRIATTDVRILRRMVRDNFTRGRNAETTLLTWQSVRDGEEKNIFPYQEEADIMFNSTLAYEISVLKYYAEPLLKSIPEDSPAILQARRLLMLLSYFKCTTSDVIPKNSIIREFIGGSCFEY